MVTIKHPTRIRELRLNRSLTQEQLSQLTGFTAASISRHESGNRAMDGATIDRYAQVFHVSPVELFVDLTQWQTMYEQTEAERHRKEQEREQEREEREKRIAQALTT